MSIPNPIPHKTLYINDYICSCYAFVFIFEFSEYISKHILQFHVFCYYRACCHDCTLTNRNTGTNNGIRTNPHIITNYNISLLLQQYRLH